MDNDSFLKKKIYSYYKKLKFKLDYYDKEVYKENEGNQLLYEMLCSDKPFMISRFGATELNCINCYINKKKYTNEIKYRIRNHAGVFPDTDENLNLFSEFYLDCSKLMDVIAVWGINNERKVINSHCIENIRLIKPRALEPYYFNTPWSRALENKKVLIVHPFVETIFKQYNKSEELFKNKEILPKFTTFNMVKAVQSIAGQQNEYKNWFEAYDFMCNEINKQDFDVAIIGAGAYGLPLSAYVKKLGKQAIHMGGATQILFGIKGKRWDDHKYISKLYNDNWIRPSVDETPKESTMVEGGSYW